MVLCNAKADFFLTSPKKETKAYRNDTCTLAWDAPGKIHKWEVTAISQRHSYVLQSSYKTTLAKPQIQSPFFKKWFIQAATSTEMVHQSNKWNKALVL